MKVYVVRNRDGKYFKATGYGSSGPGKHWVALQDAKLYTKLGQARGRVSFWARAYPEYGVPEILEMEIDPASATVLNEKERVVKSIAAELTRAMKELGRLRAGSLAAKAFGGSFNTLGRGEGRLQREINRLEAMLKALS